MREEGTGALASTIIDTHKAVTPFFIAGLMWYFQNFSAPAAIYLACHGTYAAMWVAKSVLIPDQRFVRPTTTAEAVLVVTLLNFYWVAPYVLISSHVATPPAVMAAAVALQVLGTFLHIGADTQKHFALKYNPGHLITDGFYARMRHPNYLGEICIYLSFALLPMSPAVFALWMFVMLLNLGPGVLGKEKSLSRYPEWPAYKERTGLLLPKLF